MPVDLGVSNAILQAYLAGHQQALEKQKFAQQKEYQTAELEQRKKEEEDRVKQHEAELKSHAEDFEKTYALNKAVHDFALLKSKQDIAENISETGKPGISTIGGKLQGEDFDETGQFPTTLTFTHPLFGDQPITVEHPQARIFRKGQEAEAVEAPKRLTRTQIADIQSETRKETNAQITARQKELQDQKLDHDKEIKELQLKNNIEVANIKGGYALKAAQLRSDAALAKLPQSVKDKVTSYNLLENKATALKSMLEQTYPDGQTGYDKFYKGKLIGGSLADISGAFQPDEDAEKIRTLSADIEADAKNMLGKFGGALTKTELDILENMAPSPNRNLTGVRAKAIVNGFLLGIQNIKGEIADQNKINQTSSPTTARKVTRIRVDDKGNEIQ